MPNWKTLYTKALRGQYKIKKKTIVGRSTLFPGEIVDKSHRVGSVVRIRGKPFKIKKVRPSKASYGLTWMYIGAKKEGSKYIGSFDFTPGFID